MHRLYYPAAIGAVIAAVVVFVSSPAAASIELVVNGEKQSSDVSPQLIEGRTLVPLRFVAAALEFDVSWDETTRTAVVGGPGITVTLPVGVNQAVVNGKSAELDVPAAIIDGRTMVPLRFISQQLGASVDWDGQNELVTVTLPKRRQTWPGPETFRIGNAVAPINYWMTAWMLNDVLKQAGFEAEPGDTRRSVMWVPVIDGQWELDKRYEIPTDQYGWPTSMRLDNGCRADRYSTIVMGDENRPRAFPEGQYRLLFEGDGELLIEGAQVVSETPGELIVDYDGQQTLMISILQTNPENHLRGMRLLRPDAVEGERFNRRYLEYLRPFSVIRPLHFLGEQLTYGSYASWEERKTVDYSHWGGAFGAPYEVAIDLANQSVSDLWLNVPIAADDNYVRNLARLTLSELDPERRLYIELGNELWNFTFPYSLGRENVLEWAQERWPDALGTVQPYTKGDEVSENMMIYSWQGARTVELKRIFHDVWGKESDRLTVVLAGQIGASTPSWHPSRHLLECPVAVDQDGIEPCGYNVDALAVAPYIGEEKGSIEFDRSSPESFLREAIAYTRGEGQWGADSVEPGMRFHIRSDRQLAAEYGLPLIAYEGGQHFVGSTYTRDVINTNYMMRELYDALFDVWQKEGGGLFVHFAGIIPRGQNEPGNEPNYFQTENFGIKERQTQTREEAPKWDEVLTTMEELGQLK